MPVLYVRSSGIPLAGTRAGLARHAAPYDRLEPRGWVLVRDQSL